jgi:hypothetical protein
MKTTATYDVGQMVRFMPGTHERAYGGLFEVVARLPEERGERQYRVKSAKDNHQRIVRESQINSIAGGGDEQPPGKRDDAASDTLTGQERLSLKRLVTGATLLSIPIGHLARFRHLGLTKSAAGGEIVTEKGKQEAGRRVTAAG